MESAERILIIFRSGRNIKFMYVKVHEVDDNSRADRITKAREKYGRERIRMDTINGINPIVSGDNTFFCDMCARVVLMNHGIEDKYCSARCKKRMEKILTSR